MSHVLLFLCLAQTPYAEGSRMVGEGRYWQALDKLNQAIAMNPNDARAYAARGGAHMGINRNSAAIADYAYALQLDPNLALAAYGLSRAYQAVGQTDAAQEWYQRYRAMPGADLSYAPVGAGAPGSPAGYGAAPPQQGTGTRQAPPPPGTPITATPVPNPQPTATPAPAGTSLIYVFRNQELGESIPIQLLMDSQPVGDLKNKQYVEINVLPGAHIIAASGIVTTSTLPIATTPAPQYVLLRMVPAKSPGDSPVPELQLVNPSAGLAHLRNVQKAYAKSIGIK